MNTLLHNIIPIHIHHHRRRDGRLELRRVDGEHSGILTRTLLLFYHAVLPKILLPTENGRMICARNRSRNSFSFVSLWRSTCSITTIETLVHYLRACTSIAAASYCCTLCSFFFTEPHLSRLKLIVFFFGLLPIVLYQSNAFRITQAFLRALK